MTVVIQSGPLLKFCSPSYASVQCMYMYIVREQFLSIIHMYYMYMAYMHGFSSQLSPSIQLVMGGRGWSRVMQSLLHVSNCVIAQCMTLVL